MPIWSEFLEGMQGPTDGPSVQIKKRERRDSRTADLVRILKGNAGIHGRPNRSKLKKISYLLNRPFPIQPDGSQPDQPVKKRIYGHIYDY